MLFGFLAGITPLELVSGIVILPQRQTALVAKQAAEVDLLTGGRFRLGVGLGWNAVEYETLGRSFSDRGRRSEEQVELLRRLWTERSVTYEGPSERVPGAGLAPLPIQRPIPIWFGGTSERALRRVGRLGQRLVSPGGSRTEARRGPSHRRRGGPQRRPRPRRHRDGGPGDLDEGGADVLVDHVGRWRQAGASHLSVNTMGAGLATVDDHVKALAAAAAALELSAS